MTTFSKTPRTSLAAALLLAGVTTIAQGQAPSGGGSAFGGGSRGSVQIKGNVVCAACSLEEVRRAQPQEQKLYQLSYQHGQVVMNISAVNGSSMFDAFSTTSRLWVRAPESVLQQLGAEENLLKGMEITGVLRSTGTLDVASITITG
jgi:hypothetical protein